jgi:hypothetical protein
MTLSNIAEPARPDLRLLKTIVLVLGILLVVGFGALVATMILRTSHLGELREAAPATLSLPADARIGHIALDGGMLAVHIEKEGAEEILVVDLRTGEVKQRLAVARQ